MRVPVIFDIETIKGTQSQMDLYRSVKCDRCDHNPVNNPKQKKDYCGECDDDAALKWPTAQTVCVTAKVLGGEDDPVVAEFVGGDGAGAIGIDDPD